MRIQPRKQILDIWRDMLRECYSGGKWVWGGRSGSNPISDAEQLLCMYYPITQIPAFGIFDPDGVQADVLQALKPLGESSGIPRTLVDVTLEYFANHSDEDGEPRFGAVGYLRTQKADKLPPGTSEVLELGVVDSYSMSITLCLSLLIFINARLEEEKQLKQREKLVDLQAKASRRLTAAMVGMLRSFVVNSVGVETSEGQAILDMLRQGDTTDAELQQGLKDRFGRLRSQLHSDVRLGVPDETKPEDDQLFECGWTWGIARDAAPITEYSFDLAVKPGVAMTRPFLYFTVSALDGIVDLTSRRIRALNILEEDQRRLADALALRWDLTQRYWSAVARFDPENWPLQDIPWRTSDGEESDYYSLLVVSVLIQDLINRAATDADLVKAVDIIEELARRGRITSRMITNDPALTMHYPGVRQGLVGTEGMANPGGEVDPEEEGGGRLAIFTADYAPLIIKRSLQAAQLTDNVEARERLMAVAESAMDHLNGRRLRRGPVDIELWDDVSDFPGMRGHDFSEPSWYMTERLVEALVATAAALDRDPPRDPAMYDHLLRLLNEADHVYNQELLRSNINDRTTLSDRLQEIGGHIKRARELRYRRTSTSIALVERALRLLDALEEARDDAARSS